MKPAQPQKICITPTCKFCKTEDPSSCIYPHSEDGKIMTRVAWAGFNQHGDKVLEIEMMAGKAPSRVEFPGLNFLPEQAWCPHCRLVFRIGPAHPNEVNLEETPKLEIVKP